MSEIEIIYSPQRSKRNLATQTQSVVKSIPATFYDASEHDYSTPTPAFYKSAARSHEATRRGRSLSPDAAEMDGAEDDVVESRAGKQWSQRKQLDDARGRRGDDHQRMAGHGMRELTTEKSDPFRHRVRNPHNSESLIQKSVSSAPPRSTPTPKEGGPTSPWRRRVSSPNSGGGKVISSPPTSPRAKEEGSLPQQHKRYSYSSNTVLGLERKTTGEKLPTAHDMPPLMTTVFDRIYGNFLSRKGDLMAPAKKGEMEQGTNVNAQGGAASFSATSPQRLRHDRVYSPPRGATPPARSAGGAKTPFRVTGVHTHNKLFSSKTVSMAGVAPPPASNNAEVTSESSAAPPAAVHKRLRERIIPSPPSSPTTYTATTRVSGRTTTKHNSEVDEDNHSDDAVIESMEEIVVVDKGSRYAHRRPNDWETTNARKKEVGSERAAPLDAVVRHHQRKEQEEALVAEEEFLERARESARREEYRRRLFETEKKEREAADRLAEARDIDRCIAENYLPPLKSSSSSSCQEKDSEDEDEKDRKSYNRTRTLEVGGGSLHRSAKAGHRQAERRASLEAHQVSAIRRSDLGFDRDESIASLSDASLQHALSFVTTRASPRKKYSPSVDKKSAAQKEASPLKKIGHPRPSAFRRQSSRSGSDSDTDDECSTIADSLENTEDEDEEAQERYNKEARRYVGGRTTDPSFVLRKNKRIPTARTASTSKSKKGEAEHHSFYNNSESSTKVDDNPLLYLSRESLTEQLMRYAKAYERERSARIEAAGRVSELSKLADTSTSLAETSDRNCKAVLFQLDEAGIKLGDASSRLAEALEENTKFRAFLVEAKARFDQTEASNKALRETNVELESLLRPLQKEHEALRHEHDRHQQEMLALKARHDLALQTQRVKHESEVEHSRQTVDRLERENKELRGVMSDLESAHQRERKELGQKLSDAYAEADKAKAALEAVRVELRNVAASAENERDSHSRQEHIYVGELESLKSRIASLSSQYEQCSLRKKELEHEMVAVREAHNAMTVKVKTTLAELESTDSEKESRKMLERQNAEMERQIMELRATLQTFMTARRLH